MLTTNTALFLDPEDTAVMRTNFSEDGEDDKHTYKGVHMSW